MDGTEQERSATLVRRGAQQAGTSNVWKLGALLALVLLMADLLTRQIGLVTGPSGDAAPRAATTSFLKMQVGNFRAEIQWDDQGK